MTVAQSIVDEARRLWQRRALTRRSEVSKIAVALRPNASSPSHWLTAVHDARTLFLEEVGKTPMRRAHVDAFFAMLSENAALPRRFSAEDSHAA